MTLYPPAYPTSQDVQIYVSPNWVTIGAYVIGDIEVDWGIMGNKPADKMGYIGGMGLTLNNSTGLFVPGTVGAMTGFDKGVKIRVVITYDGNPHVRFKGRITKIGMPYNVNDISLVSVKASDWFHAASKQVVIEQAIETDITAAAAVTAILTHANVQPDATDIDDSGELLDSAFHSISARSTVFSELAKLSASDFAYYYLRKDRTYGETLRIENRSSRVSVDVSPFPVPQAYSDNLVLESGNDFLLIDGNTLLLDQTTTTTFDNMYQAEVEYGESLINEVTTKYTPVRTESSVEVLFSLDSPIYIGAGETLPDFRVTYKDPTGGSARTNGANMVAPVSGTDYKMYVNSNATGTNLTANLTFTVSYGSGGAVYKSMTNTGATNGWITTLQARGNAVYVDQPIETVVSDSASITSYDVSPYSMNMQYQSDSNIVNSVSEAVLDQNKANRVLPQKIRLCANLSPYLMTAFLHYDVGHLITVQEDVHEVNDNFFIQSVKFSLSPGGIIFFEWGLVDAPFADGTYWQLEVANYSELESTTYVSF